MGNDGIQKLTMPKWGLSMTHGTVVEWLVPEGATIVAGQEVLEVETDKITGCVESSMGGTLRRHVAKSGQVVPTGGLLGVAADPSIPDEEIDRFVDRFAPEDVSEDPTSDDLGPQFVQVGSRQLRYRKLGDGGLPAVLLHGFAGSLDSWLFNHTELARQRVVYALELPGHGESSKDVGDGSLETLVGVLQQWLDELSLPRVHLIGHSLGGALALGAALRSPDRVQSCTLIAPAALGREIDADYIVGVVAANRRKQLKPHLEKLFADPNRVTRQLVEDLLKFKRLDGVGDALEKLSTSLVADGAQASVFRDQLEQLRPPTQVLWGDRDQIIPSSQAAGLPERILVELLPGCGHMVQMEAARQVNQLVSSFLDSTD